MTALESAVIAAAVIGEERGFNNDKAVEGERGLIPWSSPSSLYLN